MWLIPTHGRALRLKRLLESLSEERETSFLVVKWRGDKTLYEYNQMKWPHNVSFILSPPDASYCGEKLNYVFSLFPDEPFYGWLADDLVWRSGPLSLLPLEAGEWGISYPDDGYAHEALPTHFCLGGKLARASGFLAHPWFPQNCMDSVWDSVGRELGLLRYVPQVLFEHEHCALSTRYSIDDTYLRSAPINRDAGFLFDNVWLPSDDRVALIERIRKGMRDEEGREEAA